jgi:hypothetical protein
MLLAQQPAFHLPIVLQALLALGVSRILAKQMFGMVAIPRVRHRARTFDRLTAHSRGTKRVVGFVVMIGTEGFPIEYIKSFVRERFLQEKSQSV